MILKSLLLVSALGLAGAASAVVDANWTFENLTVVTGSNTGTTYGPFSPETGSGAASAFHQTSSTYSTPSGNGSTKSFSSNTWSVGDYYQFMAPTTGVANVGFSFDQTNSSTGPANFGLSYSLDGTAFTQFAAYSVATVAWSASTAHPESSYNFDLSSVTTLGNKSAVYFRLIDLSTLTSTGGTVGTAGTNRVDNVAVGTFQPTPEPASFAALGVGALALLRRRRAK